MGTALRTWSNNTRDKSLPTERWLEERGDWPTASLISTKLLRWCHLFGQHGKICSSDSSSLQLHRCAGMTWSLSRGSRFVEQIHGVLIMYMYADDIVQYRPIHTCWCQSTAVWCGPGDCLDNLCGSLSKLQQNYINWGSSPTRDPPPAVCVPLPNTLVIPIVTSTIFLGVTITNDFKWNAHISITCAKARARLVSCIGTSILQTQ